MGINSQLPSWLLTSSTDTLSQAPAAADLSSTLTAASAESIQDLALLHLCQEAVLALLLPLACRLALSSRVTAAAVSPYWIVQTLGTCLLLFPLVDPLLSSAWRPVVEVGPAQPHGKPS